MFTRRGHERFRCEKCHSRIVRVTAVVNRAEYAREHVRENVYYRADDDRMTRGYHHHHHRAAVFPFRSAARRRNKTYLSVLNYTNRSRTTTAHKGSFAVRSVSKKRPGSSRIFRCFFLSIRFTRGGIIIIERVFYNPTDGKKRFFYFRIRDDGGVVFFRFSVSRTLRKHTDVYFN